MTELTKPCAQCPWRRENQGKKHKFGFYTKANLQRLWNQIRKGGRPQSCHLTDPSHPDHIAVGAKATSKAVECPGSVVVIRRELAKMATPDGRIEDAGVKEYLRTRKKGLSKTGILYWVVQRIGMANVPIMNCDGPLPEVDDTDEAIGLPSTLENG